MLRLASIARSTAEKMRIALVDRRKMDFNTTREVYASSAFLGLIDVNNAFLSNLTTKINTARSNWNNNGYDCVEMKESFKQCRGNLDKDFWLCHHKSIIILKQAK